MVVKNFKGENMEIKKVRGIKGGVTIRKKILRKKSCCAHNSMRQETNAIIKELGITRKRYRALQKRERRNK